MRNCRWLIGLLLIPGAWGQGLQAGAGRRDITPREPLPMWGYGDRHDALSIGVLDPLYADALVIQAGGRTIAIVGLDLGRAPAEASLQRIRQRIREQAGIEYSIIAGSHTHHGPVLELTDREGQGKGRFDAALRYYAQMEDGIVAAIGPRYGISRRTIMRRIDLSPALRSFSVLVQPIALQDRSKALRELRLGSHSIQDMDKGLHLRATLVFVGRMEGAVLKCLERR